MYSPGSYRRIHGQRGPACKPGHTPHGRERPYPGWPLGSLGWTYHDFQQSSPETLFYYKAKGRKRFNFIVLFTLVKLTKTAGHWQNLLFAKSVVFFDDFSFCNFSTLLTNLHVNIRQTLYSLKFQEKRARGTKRPSSAIKTDLNLNPSYPTTFIWSRPCNRGPWLFLLKN